MPNEVQVKVPNLGDVDAVEIIEISVNAGDIIEAEQSLITLETDKAAMEVPSPVAGKVHQMMVKQGDTVKEGDVILIVETAGEAQEAKSVVQEPVVEKTETAQSADVESTPAPSAAPSVQTIHLPDLGVDGEVEVIEWTAQVGDTIEAEQSILTLESDKASMDVPASFGGTLQKCLVQVGDKVRSNQAVAEVLTSQSSDAPQVVSAEPAKVEEPSASQPAAQAPATSSTTSAPATTSVPATEGHVHAGPGVRRLAHQLGVDLSKVSGSGRKGRIQAEDVHKHVKSLVLGAGKQTQNQGLGVQPMPEIDFSAWGEVEVKPLNRIKKLTAKNLHRNWVTIPHVTQFDEADITQLEEFRGENKASAKQMGFSLTPLAFIMKAVVSSLQAHPEFNASLAANGTDLIYKKYFNIGVAVDTPNGLVVPVVKDVDRKGLFGLAKELGVISQKARDGKLTRDEMQGSCLSISSLGSIGGTNFTPIINAPDVAILGVSKSSMKPVFEQGAFVPRLMLPLALSYDHRVIDGAQAARFTRHLCLQLEDIRKLLL